MTATECVVTTPHDNEYVILVDAQDRQIGLAEKLAAHQQNLLHRAFSVFIFRQNNQLELLLQQRAQQKYHCPGLWTNTCCSHPRSGETVTSAGSRRLQEELGMIVDLKDAGWFQYNAHFSNGLSENENDHVLVGDFDANQAIAMNPAEVQAVRWVTVENLRQDYILHPEKYTPWLMQALDLALTSISS